MLVAEPEHAAGFVTDGAKVAWMAGTATTSTAPAEEPVLFATDRGLQPLPAVREDVAGAVGPIIRADLSRISVWSPPGRPHDEHWDGSVEASADTDDPLALAWRFSGSAEAYTDYPDAAVLETATAVVVVPRPVERPDTDARRSYGQVRQVTARLEQPPGDRVLLDVYGRVAVLSAR